MRGIGMPHRSFRAGCTVTRLPKSGSISLNSIRPTVAGWSGGVGIRPTVPWTAQPRANRRRLDSSRLSKRGM